MISRKHCNDGWCQCIHYGAARSVVKLHFEAKFTYYPHTNLLPKICQLLMQAVRMSMHYFLCYSTRCHWYTRTLGREQVRLSIQRHWWKLNKRISPAPCSKWMASHISLLNSICQPMGAPLWSNVSAIMHVEAGWHRKSGFVQFDKNDTPLPSL